MGKNVHGLDKRNISHLISTKLLVVCDPVNWDVTSFTTPARSASGRYDTGCSIMQQQPTSDEDCGEVFGPVLKKTRSKVNFVKTSVTDKNIAKERAELYDSLGEFEKIQMTSPDFHADTEPNRRSYQIWSKDDGTPNDISSHLGELEQLYASDSAATMDKKDLHVITTGSQDYLNYASPASTPHIGLRDPIETPTALILSRMERLPLKDFAAEIRAGLDIDTFIKEGTFLLDLDASNLDEILEKTLLAVFSDHQQQRVPLAMPSPNNLNDQSDTVNSNLDSNQLSKTSASTVFFTNRSNSSRPAGFEKSIDPKIDLATLVADAKKALLVEISFEDHAYNRLAKTIKGVSIMDDDGLATDQSWVCAMCSMNCIHKRCLALAKLATPVNIGRSNEGTCLIALIIAPTKEKGTKSEIEVGRTLATVLSDPEFRTSLLYANTVDEVKSLLWARAQELAAEQETHRRRSSNMAYAMQLAWTMEATSTFCTGIFSDLKRRLPHYWSDFKEGVCGKNTIQKVLSTTLFLYFACLLSSIAFGVLNYNNTDGKIGVKQMIVAQTIGGVCNGFFGGQPLLVLLSTAPLALYIKTFREHYIGPCLPVIQRFSNLSQQDVLLPSSSRGHENFTTISSPDGQLDTDLSADNCDQAVALLYLLLLLGTVWLAMYLVNFTKTPFLTAGKRELLTDFALPISVLTMTLVGSLAFKDIKMQPFNAKSNHFDFKVAPLELLSWTATFGAFGLAIPLSLLFYMEQNIASALVNSPANRLRKGPANHWDLLVVSLINIFFSSFCLPWMHAALPHSPLHVKALADIEERIEIGQHIRQTIVRVRETRLTTIFAHVLIGLSLLMLPVPLNYIPPAVLNGLFVYMAMTAVAGNQMFERILLFITEQSAYPPSHYIRRVPQRKLHLFTFCQLIQLAVLCAVGFAPSPYVELAFPLLLVHLIIVRHTVVPKIIENKYLDALDRAF
ncbi:unnamed protein product [Calicophoron daubneyi]|uniref:Bicarbonate transporter-like transmembrane domain-containing protein n=1 Tax=Calicophoron daubneyi TaxID=300641 RepID=A0AAV2TSH7_CALDB